MSESNPHLDGSYKKKKCITPKSAFESIDQFGCNISVSITTKTLAGGIMTFLCFGFLIGYSIY